jgi:hypothetical protein
MDKTTLARIASGVVSGALGIVVAVKVYLKYVEASDRDARAQS